MTNNHDLIEVNEVSIKSNGGTELFMRFLYSGIIPRKLLEQVQIIPGRIRELKEDKVRVLTVHDLPNDPELQKLGNPAFRKKFHKIVFISNWQYQQFRNVLKIPFGENCIVIENGIPPAILTEPKPKDVINIAYFTTPHRGLNILLPSFGALAEKHDDIRLHVHSSFKAYGWDDGDKQFEDMFNFARNHPKIEYYGFTSYQELLEKIKNYHIFAYPSIWPETACRALIEAMSARLLCVHPNLAALPDTSGGLNMMYQGSDNHTQHSQVFATVLNNAIEVIRTDSSEINNHLDFIKFYVDWRYNPVAAEKKWTNMLTDLVDKYPTEESRKITSSDSVWVFDTNTGRMTQ